MKARYTGPEGGARLDDRPLVPGEVVDDPGGALAGAQWFETVTDEAPGDDEAAPPAEEKPKARKARKKARRARGGA